MVTAMNRPMKVSCKVMGKAFATISLIGTPVNDSPRSRRTRPAR